MTSDKLPILEYPGSSPALIEPSKLFGDKPRIHERCILCFFRDEIDKRRKTGELRRLRRLFGEGEATAVYATGEGDDKLTVCFPGIGAPVAAAILEELIALGGRYFICCGGCGVLDGSIPAGQLLLPTEAVRDEGTSYKYQPSGRTSRPNPEAVLAIQEACRARGVGLRSGLTWTNDALFRETPEVIRRRREEGCISVEMEAAALFAVADFRGVVLGQILYAGDDVSGLEWNHRHWLHMSEAREQLYELSLDACRRLGRRTDPGATTVRERPPR
jgi:uridine phosphorylase